MVRLTTELILKSCCYFNAIKGQELDLQGNSIAAIENLGAIKNQFNTIDLSNDEIFNLKTSLI